MGAETGARQFDSGQVADLDDVAGRPAGCPVVSVSHLSLFHPILAGHPPRVAPILGASARAARRMDGCVPPLPRIRLDDP